MNLGFLTNCNSKWSEKDWNGAQVASHALDRNAHCAWPKQRGMHENNEKKICKYSEQDIGMEDEWTNEHGGYWTIAKARDCFDLLGSWAPVGTLTHSMMMMR